MKIVMVTHTFLPRIGGREVHVAKLSKALADRGHEITIVTSGKQSVSNKNGVTVIRVPEKTITLSNYPRKVKYRVLPQLFSILRRIDCDIIHAHDILHFTTDVSTTVSLFRKTPLVLTIHGFYPDTSFLYAVTKIYYATIAQIIFKMVEKIICPSEYLVRYLHLSESKRVAVIPNGTEIYHLQKISNSFPRLLAVGRLVPKKGFHIAILAMKEILQKIPNTQLDIVGPDSYGYGKLLKALATKTNVEGAVNFRGFVCKEELDRYYRNCDLFILPSIDDNFPLTLIDALGYGKPVIATDVGGVSEIILDRHNGLLVSPNNPHELAEATITLLKDEHLRVKLANNKGITSWEMVAQKTEKIYQDVLRG